ncbi:MAG: peptidyl-prolyl cis-trans isomerase [Phycisphaerae bacterium]|nr:peptidyl-prolyl cis-trans isomerase [Phycisphaerae bacterium]
MNPKKSLRYLVSLTIFFNLTSCLLGQQASDPNSPSVQAVGSENLQKPPVVPTGVVLAVNGGALASSQVISVIHDKLREHAAVKSQDQFVRATFSMVQEATMGKLYNLLLYQQAKKDLKKMGIDQDALDKAMKGQRKEFLVRYKANEAVAQAELAKIGSSLKEQLEQIERNMIIASYRDTFFASSTVITRSQMLRYYRKNLKAVFTQAASIQFQLIDIEVNKCASAEEAKKQAEAALNALKEGMSFDEVVKTYSHGFRKEQNGLWQPYQPDDIHPQYKSVVSALADVKKGEITGIIESDGSDGRKGPRFFIAKLIDRKEDSITPFSQAQFQIGKTLREESWDKYSNRLVKELMGKATMGDLDLFIGNTVLVAYNQLK